MPTSQKTQALWLASLIVLAGFWLRTRNQAHWEFWADEAVSVQHTWASDWFGMIDSLAHNEGMPPLYFALLRLWRKVGETEIVLRALSLWQGAISLALMTVLGRRMLGGAGGLLAAALFAFSAMHIMLSQWARPYSLGLCWAIGLMLAVHWLGGQPNHRMWIIFWGMSAAAMYTLYTFGFLLGGMALYLAYRRRALPISKALWPIAGVEAGVLAVFAPWFPILAHQFRWAPKALWWVPPPHLRMILEMLDQFLIGAELRGWPKPATLILVPLLAVLVVLGLYRAWKGRRLAYPMLIVVTPLSLVWLLSYHSPIFLPRHVFFALPGVLLILADGLLLLGGAVRRWAAVGLVAVCLLAQGQPLVDASLTIPWSQAAAYVAEHAQTNDVVIFSPPFQQAPFQLKYTGPPLQWRGIGDYEAYVTQPDVVLGLQVPLASARRWATGRTRFWLVEDARWPVGWGNWEYMPMLTAKFPGVTVYLFER